ncbi:nuclear transport factor 2 family protein [Micromonospora sp. NPDC048935]|uniref:nuclear transport factor 2 family protein n=1 Tax=Micromonospora sp. NPDC048935 TaxID=3364262 RepID=UPI0037217EFA
MTQHEELSADARRARNVATLRDYYRLLSRLDIDGWIELWAEDCLQLMPYATGGLPSSVAGRPAVYELYKQMATGYSVLRYDDVELYPLQDPDKVFARWKPTAQLVDGTSYRNENAALFEFDATGRIVRFVEYFNPVPLLEGTPGVG